MQQQSAKSPRTTRRSAGVAGVKALIAVASVAATVAGWAILPANDPQAAAGAAAQTNQQPPSLSVPGGSDSLQVPNDPFQVPNTNQSLPSSPDNSQLPQVQAPQGFSRFPFTRTHSSR